MPKELSVFVLMFAWSAGPQNDGHPVPESNFSDERNSGVPQQIQR
jgi:hypothetical protein